MTSWPLRIAMLVLCLTSSPTLAQDLAALLADPDAVPEAAIAVCALGVTDPAAADGALTGAGWSKSEGEGEGVHEYARDDVWIMMWDEPGFCMASSSLSTVEFWDALHAVTYHRLQTSLSADGCEVAYLTRTISVTLNGPGNDPACSSDEGSALRFEIVN